jgi:hypothetical protein
MTPLAMPVTKDYGTKIVSLTGEHHEYYELAEPAEGVAKVD